MEDFLSCLSPVALIFFPVALGTLAGKIKIKGISFGLSSVLIVAVVSGKILSSITTDASYIVSSASSFGTVSSVGISVFVSAVGISAGYSVSRAEIFKKLLSFFIGASIVSSGILLAFLVIHLDADVSRSVLIGILCGSMTSTPGMAAANDLPDIDTASVGLGYGSSYLFGVLITVLSVQLIAKKEKCKTEDKHNACIGNNSNVATDLFAGSLSQISLAVLLGSLVGKISIPLTGVSIGSSGGELLVGILVGMMIRRLLPKHIAKTEIAFLRHIGLVLFLSGTGFRSGLTASGSLEPRWLFYGFCFSALPVMIGFLLGKMFRFSPARIAHVVAGGMTSTPAIGVLSEKTDVDYIMYSNVYLGALIAMVLEIRLL